MTTVSQTPFTARGTAALDWEGSTNSAKTHECYKQKRTVPLRRNVTLWLSHAPVGQRRYFGYTRRWMFLAIGITFLILLAVILGLAVGLSRHSKSQDLPLPSNARNFTGDLTYYTPALGACGTTSSIGDDICSISHVVFDAASVGSDPNSNPLCGQKIRARRFDEQVEAQRSVDLTVVDRCVGCAAVDLDVSPGAFNQLANEAQGRVDVTWAWLSPQATT